MISLINSFIKKKFVRNVLVVATGTATAQFIAMIASPIITRIYGPEAYGLMGVFLAIISFVSPIATLTYSNAIVLPKNNSDAISLVKLSILICLTLASLIFLLLIFLKDIIISLLKLQDINNLLLLLPLVILFAGIYQTIEQWVIRLKEFNLIAKTTIFHSIILQGSKVGFGFFYPNGIVLVIITAISDVIKTFILVSNGKKIYTNKNNNTNEKKSSIKNIAMIYKDFPIYRSPQILLNSANQSLPVILLTTFFGPISVGFYTISRTVLSIPTQLIGKSVGDVFYPRIAEALNKEESVSDLIKKATISLALIGIIPFGIVFLLGPNIFSYIFGENWYQAGIYAKWMSLWLYFVFINRPSIRSLPVLSAQGFHLIFTVLILIINLLSLSIGYIIFKNDFVSIALFGISGAIMNFILILLTLRKAHKLDEERLLIKN